MSESYQERKRRLAREGKRRQRERILSQEDELEREARRRKACLRARMQRLRASQGGQKVVMERRQSSRKEEGDLLGFARRTERLSPLVTELKKRIERGRIALLQHFAQEESEKSELTPEVIEERRRKQKEKLALRRLHESQEQIEERRRINREKLALNRQNLSQDEREEIRRVDRERYAERTAQLTPEEREERRKMAREKIALRRKKERLVQERRSDETEEAAIERRKKHNIETMKRLRAEEFCPSPKRKNTSSATVNSLVQPHDENNREQKAMTHSVQPSLPPGTQMQVQHHLQVAAPLPAPSQPPPRQVQRLVHPVKRIAIKPKPEVKPQPWKKRLLAVANHQSGVMSNLAFLWKSGKLCDAGIGNGSSTVMVHKLVLSAVCPKLLSVFNMDMMSKEFLQVNFPETVSKEALNAFGEYMYNGILDLDCEILKQLKVIAKRLDMKEFEQLCDKHIPNHTHHPVSAPLFTNIPLVLTTMPIPVKTLSLVPFGSNVSIPIQCAPSINTPVIDIKQESPKAELVQVEKEPAAVFGQESEVASLTPKKPGYIIKPIVKTEWVGPEDDKYGHWGGSSSNQAFTSTNSSSSSSTIASSTEYSIPFSEATDVKSTRLKATHSYEAPLVSDLSPASGIVETVRSQSNSMNEDSSKPLSQPLDSLSSVNLSNSNDAVYPVRLFSARGDNLPLLTTHSSDAMTVNSFIKSEKT